MDSFKTSNWCSWRKLRRSNRITFVTRKEDCCETKGVSSRDSAILSLAAEREIRHSRYQHPKEAAATTRCEYPRDRVCAVGGCHSDEGNGKCKSSGARRPSVELLKLKLLQDRTILLELNRLAILIWREGNVSTAIEGYGHWRTSQEGRQDRVRKLPRHLAHAARGKGAP